MVFLLSFHLDREVKLFVLFALGTSDALQVEFRNWLDSGGCQTIGVCNSPFFMELLIKRTWALLQLWLGLSTDSCQCLPVVLYAFDALLETLQVFVDEFVQKLTSFLDLLAMVLHAPRHNFDCLFFVE